MVPQKKVIIISFQFLKLGVLGCFFAGITGFVFLSSYEVLFRRDIPIVHTYDRMRSEEIVNNATGVSADEMKQNINSEYIGMFGLPKALKIPVLTSRLTLEKAVVSDGRWLARSNSGHYIVTSPGENGNMGDIVIYAHAGWRTITSPRKVNIGDNIFVDTDTDWRYMYRVTSKNILAFDDVYVRSENSQGGMILLIEDERESGVYVFEGVYVSIQNIRR